MEVAAHLGNLNLDTVSMGNMGRGSHEGVIVNHDLTGAGGRGGEKCAMREKLCGRKEHPEDGAGVQ